jgi:sugar phosphate isomerase/epimerase
MTTYHWSFLEDVTAYRANGVNQIGVWRRKFTDFGEERGIELLRESGLAVSSFSSAGGFTGADGHTFREAVDDAHDALRQAADMRAACLVVVGGARAGHTIRHAQSLLRDALLELGDAAARLNVSVALQAVHRRPVERWSFLTSLKTTLDLLVSCDHPHVGLVFDFFHFWREPDLFEVIPQVIPWIKIAALCDARAPAECDDDRCLPGEGLIPLGDIIAALEAGGYGGVYDVQLLSEKCWSADYPTLLKGCREALSRIAPQTFPFRAQSPESEPSRLIDPARAPLAAPPP